jgi:uncharacterized membrane protein
MFAQAPTTAAEPGTDANTIEPSTPTRPGGVQAMVKDTGFVVWSLVLSGLLLIAALIFFFFDRWRKRPVGQSARELSLSLNSFKDLYDNGEITEAEYERIKAKWAAKLKEKTGSHVAPAPPPETPVPAPPTDPPTE